MDLIHTIYRKFPKLKEQILMAHMKMSPLKFIKQNFVNALLFSLILSFMSMFFLKRIVVSKGFGIPEFVIFLFAILILFPMLSLFLLSLFLNSPVGLVKKRQKEIEKDVLFAGRYLLIKLNSGKPILNSIMDASKSYGVGGKFFKEIVDDVTLGMALEDALERAIRYSPSDSFRKILFQIHNSIKIGVDVTTSLQGVLDEITENQIIEIERYSNKLNSIAMFYMLVAIVGPSLGLTIFVVIAGMLGFPITFGIYVLLWCLIIITQGFFINLFKSIRPNINF